MLHMLMLAQNIIFIKSDDIIHTLCSGVGTYTDTPDWSGQSFWKIILKTQLEIVDFILSY